MDWRINNISHHTITASQLNSLISANFWSFRNVTHRSTTVQCNRNRNPLRGINCFNSPDTVCWRVASHFFYLRLKCKQPLFDQHIWWYEHQVGSSTITWVRDTNNNSKKKNKMQRLRHTNWSIIYLFVDGFNWDQSHAWNRLLFHSCVSARIPHATAMAKVLWLNRLCFNAVSQKCSFILYWADHSESLAKKKIAFQREF